MRRVVLTVALVGLAFPTAAPAADSVTLAAHPGVITYGGVVRLDGTAAMLADVFLVQKKAAGWTVVAQTRAGTDGRFSFERRVRSPAVFQARTLAGQSGEVGTTVRPLLRARRIANEIRGRLQPISAGRVLLGGRRVRVRPNGRFRARLPERPGRHVRVLRLKPAPGFTRLVRRFSFRVRRPELRIGSHGPNVLLLKRRLAELGYALPAVDSGYGYATYEAVLAFQKVHWMRRTGRVDRGFWRVLASASRPRPRVRHGDYIEVDKSRQVLFEVRGGEVVRAVHVSTGATGNTPVGTWRVYREVFGWDWVLYHPMYFLRGFAIHGYPSVPPWPASHGCVRIPLWLASGLRERWGSGSIIRVYA